MSAASIGVFTERQVGIGSAAAALEPYLRNRENVHWTDVTYFEQGGVIERLPFPGRVGGTLRGFLQTGGGLRRHHDALFFLTHNPAVFHQQRLGATPTLLWTDVTPELLDRQAAQYDHPVDKFGWLHRLKYSAVRRTFRRAALCVGWSDWARRSFVADYGVLEAHTRVVAPGVDLARWTGGGERAVHAGLPRLLFVGGNFERKGGRLLLEVFRARLRGRCALDLVTRDAVEEEPGVSVHRGLTPKSPALLALYRNADAFVLPTAGDCFSIASLEAMAMQLPVIVTAVGGIPEIVEHGRSGYLIPPGNGQELASSVDALLRDRAATRAMGARGRALCEERFDAEKVAARLLALLDEIAISARS